MRVVEGLVVVVVPPPEDGGREAAFYSKGAILATSWREGGGEGGVSHGAIGEERREQQGEGWRIVQGGTGSTGEYRGVQGMNCTERGILA